MTLCSADRRIFLVNFWPSVVLHWQAKTRAMSHCMAWLLPINLTVVASKPVTASQSDSSEPLVGDQYFLPVVCRLCPWCLCCPEFVSFANVVAFCIDLRVFNVFVALDLTTVPQSWHCRETITYVLQSQNCRGAKVAQRVYVSLWIDELLNRIRYPVVSSRRQAHTSCKVCY